MDLRKFSQDFIERVRKDCELHGVKLLITSQPVTPDGCQTNGYFCGSTPELALKEGVFSSDPGLAVHEYCHMQQWLEDKERFNQLDGFDKLEEWLNGEHHNHLDIMKSIDRSFDLEADCEQRSVDMLRSYDLDTSYISRYIQKANAYLTFYHVVRIARQWYAPGKAPYEIAQIVDAMPTIKIVSPGDASRLMSRSDIPWWMCFD